MQSKILYLFTRTPLHVGAGSSVGAVDQPVQRERHTGFPIIPASSLKGTFADAWNESLKDEEPDKENKVKKVRVTKAGDHSTASWLFGSDSDQRSCAGALLFSEARILAFPIRSAKGCFAWITCPMMLQRAASDGVFDPSLIAGLKEPDDGSATFIKGGKLDVKDGQIVLEEYCFKHGCELPTGLGNALSELIADDLWQHLSDRLVILSNGMMSHFATTACEVAQHVRISDETGTAEDGGLFNQENVPSDTLFYSVLRCLPGRGAYFKTKTANDLVCEFKAKTDGRIFQFGGDASTGLGFCSVKLNDTQNA